MSGLEVMKRILGSAIRLNMILVPRRLPSSTACFNIENECGKKTPDRRKIQLGSIKFDIFGHRYFIKVQNNLKLCEWDSEEDDDEVVFGRDGNSFPNIKSFCSSPNPFLPSVIDKSDCFRFRVTSSEVLCAVMLVQCTHTCM